MKQYTESYINVSWKPPHMINQGCEFSTKSAKGDKTASAYVRWWGMFSRCYCPADPGYPLYGAKGITVSHEWGNYQNYARWYNDECIKLGIDPDDNTYQIDKDLSGYGEYSPTACKLIPQSENIALGTSKDHTYIDPNGDEVVITNLNKFCRDTGLSRKQMYRLRNGTCKIHRGWRKA